MITVSYRLKQFFGKLSRIVRFIPKLWRYETWDHAYLFSLWADVLNENIKQWNQDCRHYFKPDENRRKSMQVCYELLKRLADERVDTSHFREIRHPKRTKTSCSTHGVDRKACQATPGNDCFFRFGYDYKDEHEKYLYLTLIKQEFYRQEKQMAYYQELFCKTFIKHSRTWWN